jgi:RimJ/RimL family protein N-acetyltransferase
MPAPYGKGLTIPAPGGRVSAVLVGDRVELRNWRTSDAPEVHRICQDPEIQRWTEVPVPYGLADAVRFVTAGDDALFAVVDRASGLLAGSMGVLRFHAGVAAVGYWTAPEMRGAGRTAEALRLLTGWCFAARGCARVELVADVLNAGSRGVARAAGFVEEGVLRSRMVHRGRRIDVVMCSRLAEDPAP